MSACRQRGLTLVEVLATVVLLSAVTGACVTILRDATRVTGSVPLDAEAREAMQAWSAASSADGDDHALVEPWAWIAPSGSAWSVTGDGLPAPALSNPEPAPARPGKLTLRWTPVTLQCDQAPGQVWTFWMTESQEAAPDEQ